MKNTNVNQKIVVSILIMVLLVFSMQDMSYGQTLPPHLSIYWVDLGTGKIQYWDGSNSRDLATGLLFPKDVALDIEGDKMYWALSGLGGKIQRANLDGSNATDLVTGLSGAITSIALDVGGGKIYWTSEDIQNSKIQCANLDGSNVRDLVTGNLGNIGGIALDLAGDKIYWTNYSINRIQCAYLDGSNMQDLINARFENSSPAVKDIALDVANGKIYWTATRITHTGYTGNIQRANLDGSNITELVTGIGAPNGITLDVAGGKMYWTRWMATNDSKIQCANLDGSNVHDLVTGLSIPEGIALGVPLQTPGGGPKTPPNVVTPEPTVVHIPDPNLRAAVQQVIGNQITTKTMLNLTTLYPQNRGITNLTGLEYATNLIELRLNANSILDISSLAGLTQLTTLDLHNNSISDISPLSGLTQLTELLLHANDISDISPLARMTQLQKLFLGDNNISDISPLSGLTQLTELGLYNNSISNISPLARMTQLTTLKLDNNSISDISPLARMTQLTTLGLRANPLNDAALTTHIPAIQANGTQVWFDNRTLTTPPPEKWIENTVVNQTSENIYVIYSTWARLNDDIPPGYVIRGYYKIAPGEQRSFYAWSTNNIYFRISQYGEALKPNSSTLTFPFWIHSTKAFNLVASQEINSSIPKNALTYSDHARDDLIHADGFMEYSNGSQVPVTSAWVKVNATDPVTIPPNVVTTGSHPPIYWVNFDGDKIQHFDGSNVTDIVTGLDRAWDIALDVTGSTIYWIASHKIQSANFDGSNVTDIVTGLDTITGLALDVAGGKMYWTLWKDNYTKIQRADFDGSNVTDIVTILDRIDRLALDVAGGKMYWTLWKDNYTKIQRADLNGSNVTDIVTGSIAHDIALDTTGGKIYWIHGTEDPTVGGYFPGTIRCADLDGSNVRDLVTTGDSLNDDFDGFIDGLALDGVGGGIYWTALNAGKILRANLDGSNVTDIITDLAYPTDIALGISPQTTGTSPTYRSEDVNQDGKVDYVDVGMVAVALFGGNPPANPGRLDVNGDGVLNLLDLILVINNLDEDDAMAAPTLGTQRTVLDRDKIQAAIDLMLATGDGSLGVRRTLAFLQNLLVQTPPDSTQLLANYPNPFNPETWIPYQLSMDSNVRITIYDVNGKVIRRLVLGYQSTGYYTSRSRAAYWDGRNAAGEPVASGVYFYTFTAGDFTATRKLLIRK